MPRTVKCRRVCMEPRCQRFSPENGERFLVLQVEELEALRLCDLEELDQATAARQMDISRGTFQRILYSARKKTADALVNGLGISIMGGNYEVSLPCRGKKPLCSHCGRIKTKETEES